MALDQLNLKLAPAVAAHWRREAAAAGLSVRDWLIRQTMPGEAPAPPAEAGLGDRVGELERQVAGLLARKPAPSPPRKREAPAPSPLPLPPSGDAPAEAIESAELARLLGIQRSAFNTRVGRAGGARAGLVVGGWRCVGTFPSPAGGPPRPRWVPDRVPEPVPDPSSPGT